MRQHPKRCIGLCTLKPWIWPSIQLLVVLTRLTSKYRSVLSRRSWKRAKEREMTPWSKWKRYCPCFLRILIKKTLHQDMKLLAGQEFIGIRDVAGLKKYSCEIQKMVVQATKAVQILMVSPATNAISERSFSKLKILKTHLRSTCGDLRLSHLMACSINKDITIGNSIGPHS